MELTAIYNALTLSKKERRRINKVISKSKKKDLTFDEIRKVGEYLPGFLFTAYHFKGTPDSAEHEKYSHDTLMDMIYKYYESVIE